MAKIPKKLIIEAKRLIRWQLFLRECKLLRYQFSVGELKELLKALS